MVRLSNFARYWLPVILWAAMIYSASTDTFSAPRTSRIIGPILRWFKPDISEETIARVQWVVRKGGHVTEFAILSILLWRAWRKPSKDDGRPWDWGTVLGSWLIAVLYAVSDETHQTFVPSRGGHWLDVVWDALGAALGLGLVWCWGRWRRRW